MRGLLLLLFKTFIISAIVGIAVTCIWYTISHKQDVTDYSHVLPLIIVGAVFLNGILVAMSLPALFLVTPSVNNNNKLIGIVLYFAGPVIMLITILFMQGSMADKIVYFIMNVVYIAVYTFYYFRTVKKLNSNTGI